MLTIQQFFRLVDQSRWVFVLLLYPLGPSLHGSQNPATNPGARESQERLRIDVNLVTVGVLVTDSRKRELLGLRAEDFLLYEDGRPQKLSFFSRSGNRLPLLSCWTKATA